MGAVLDVCPCHCIMIAWQPLCEFSQDLNAETLQVSNTVPWQNFEEKLGCVFWDRACL